MTIRAQSGFTLIEAALAMMLTAGLTVVAFSALKGGESVRDDKLAVEQMQTLVSLVAARTNASSAATTNFQTTLIADDAVPEAWVDRRSTPVLRGPWGGTITLDTAMLLGSGAYPDSVKIKAAGLSLPTCVRLLMAVAPAAARIQYNSSDFKDLAGTAAITNARARTACTSAPARTYTFWFELPPL